MSLDARSIVIGVSVVLLFAIGWVLVANSDDASPNTTVGAAPTTSAPVSSATTTTLATTTSATSVTTTSTTSTAPPTTATTTTTRPSETPSTVPATPPLQDPDLSLCHDNDLPESQCRWVGVAYPHIDADPREDPLEYLRQYADFVDWAQANPQRGRDLVGLVAETGKTLADTNQRLDAWREQQKLYLSRTAVEKPVEITQQSDDEVHIVAKVVPGVGSIIVAGEVETTGEIPTGDWLFVVRLTEDGWKVAEQDPAD